MTDQTHDPGDVQDIVAGDYANYKQTQAEIFVQDAKRVRNTLITIGILFFASDLLTMAMTNTITGADIAYSLIIPVIYFAFALLALKQPLLANILGMLVFAGVIVIMIWAYGGLGVISGMIIRAIIIYFLIAGFQSARSAEQARKEMR
jgi:hypothetical protein